MSILPVQKAVMDLEPKTLTMQYIVEILENIEVQLEAIALNTKK